MPPSHNSPGRTDRGLMVSEATISSEELRRRIEELDQTIFMYTRQIRDAERVIAESTPLRAKFIIQRSQRQAQLAASTQDAPTEVEGDVD